MIVSDGYETGDALHLLGREDGGTLKTHAAASPGSIR